jgi:hypothetical protein
MWKVGLELNASRHDSILGFYKHNNEHSGSMHLRNLTWVTVVLPGELCTLSWRARPMLVSRYFTFSCEHRKSSGYHVWFVFGRHGWLSVTDTNSCFHSLLCTWEHRHTATTKCNLVSCYKRMTYKKQSRCMVIRYVTQMWLKRQNRKMMMMMVKFDLQTEWPKYDFILHYIDYGISFS